MPKPKKDETEANYVKRCIPVVMADGTAKDGSQAAAICHNMWKQHHSRNEMNVYTTLTSQYEIRTQQHQGRKHIILPVIMMVEGVHNGSHGRVFHPAAELGHFTGAWNGIPVTIQHPELNGEHVSANIPQIIDSVTVGRVYNTKMEDGKLKAEIWLDEARAVEVSPQAMSYIRQGRNLEVSVGVFSDEESIAGEWNGEEYVAIVRNHRPDHLALLPGSAGACSWADGCGVRNNEEGGGITDLIKTAKQLCVDGFALLQINALQENAEGYRELIQKLQTKLDGMDNATKVHFLQEVYSDTLVYEVHNRESGERSQLYRQSYELNSNGEVTLTGNPVRVVRKVEYVNNNEEKGLKTMAETKKPCCPKKVELLIQSKNTGFQETDREFLESLEEVQINKLVDMENLAAKEPEKVEPPAINKEQIAQVLRNQFSTPDKFVGLLPTEFQDSINSGLKLHQEKRQAMHAAILANGKSFTEDELKTMSMQMLEKVFSMVPNKVDFSVNGVGTTPLGTTVGTLLPTFVETK